MEDVTAVFAAMLEARKEERESRIELEKIRAARDVALAAITQKHDLYRMVFDKIFAERRDAIAKHFELIDEGIATNNQRLILGALQGLGNIVATSPFSDLRFLSQALERGDRIEI
jgi:hypothetical protein